MAAPHHSTDKDTSACIRSLRAAWMRRGIDDPAAEVDALSRALPCFDNDGNSTDATADEAMDALVYLYPWARMEAGRMIKYMARRHARCRCRLAGILRLSSSPFGDATALRYLGVCAEDAPDHQTVDNIGKALARLSDESPCAAAKIVVDCTFDDRLSGEGVAYALDAIARACPKRLTAAILDKTAADPAQCPDLRLASVIRSAALHADSGVILETLFAALAAGGANHHPALCMIKAMVAHNYDTVHDYGLASQTLGRLVSYAKERGTDTDSIINNDSNPCLQSAALINHLLSPPSKIDAEQARRNLELFPAMKRSFRLSWFKKAVREGRTPHPLIAWLSHHSNEDLKHLLAGPPGETVAERRTRELRLEHERGPAKDLAFIDRALTLLEDSRLTAATYVKHMRNPEQFRDTVSEIAFVVPFVAGGCKVELEPSMGQKRLDATVDLGPQRVPVEVLSPRMWRPLDLFGGPHKVCRDRLTRKILVKAAEQLPTPGTCGDPVVVAVDTSRSETTVGDAEKCMRNQDPHTDSISAVVCFEPVMSCDPSSSARGTVIPNPHARVPLDAAALEALRRVLGDVPPSKERLEGGAP